MQNTAATQTPETDAPPTRCEGCSKRRKLTEYIDILDPAQTPHWLCWPCACAKRF
jgi:hypothetical protein